MTNEKRLIDANELKRRVLAFATFIKRDFLSIEAIIDRIDTNQTEDAVEVVRCKDCRWARPQDHREPVCTPADALICQCFMHHHIPEPWGARLAVNPNGFCSYGERITDG